MVQLNKLPGCRVIGFIKYIQIPGERKAMTDVMFISKELVDKGYYLQYIDGNPYKLKAPYDFSFINRQYGKVFKVFDDQDSGNICFGTEKDGERYFIKFAGAPTESYSGTCEEAIRRLKSTLPVYGKLKHNNLIEFVKAEETGGGLAMVF